MDEEKARSFCVGIENAVLEKANGMKAEFFSRLIDGLVALENNPPVPEDHHSCGLFDHSMRGCDRYSSSCAKCVEERLESQTGCNPYTHRGRMSQRILDKYGCQRSCAAMQRLQHYSNLKIDLHHAQKRVERVGSGSSIRSVRLMKNACEVARAAWKATDCDCRFSPIERLASVGFSPATMGSHIAGACQKCGIRAPMNSSRHCESCSEIIGSPSVRWKAAFEKTMDGG